MPTEPLGVTSLAVGALGTVSAVVSWVLNRRSNQGDYAARLLDSTVPAYEAVARRLAAVEQKVDAAEAEVVDCERRYQQLAAQHDHLVQWLGTLDLKLPPLPEED
jgi:hypothetical protein